MSKGFSLRGWAPVLPAALLAVGVNTFMGPCGHGGRCDHAGLVLTLLGIGMAAASLAAMLLGGKIPRMALYAAVALAGAAAFLTPGTLVAICGMDTMSCRMVMRPAAMVLSALIVLSAGINVWMEWKKGK